MTAPSKHGWGLLWRLAPLLLLALLVFLVGPGRVVAVWREAEAGLLVISAALLPVTLGLRTAKWRLLLGGAGVEVTPGESLASLLGGMRLGFLTPGRVGEATRVLYLPRGDRMALLGLFTLDRALDFLSMVLFAVGGAVMWLDPGAAAVVVAAGALALAFVLGRRQAALLLRRLAPGRWREQAERLGNALGSLPARTLMGAALLGVLYVVAVLTQFFLLVRSFTPEMRLEALPMLPVVMLSVSLPLGTGGLGVKEGAAVLLLAPLGVPAAAAMSGSLALFLLGALPAFLSFPWVGAPAGLPGGVKLDRSPESAAPEGTPARRERTTDPGEGREE